MPKLLAKDPPPADLLGGTPVRSRAGRPPLNERKPALGIRRQEQAAMRSEEIDRAQAVLEEALHRHPHDVWAQMSYFFQSYRIQAARGRRRAASQKTTEKYVESLSAFFQCLREHANVRVRNLPEVTSKHVALAMRKWEEQGLSASTLANRYTCIRRYMNWIGKGGGLPALKDMLVDASRGQRTYSSTEPKDWESRGIDYEAVIERVEGDCIYTGMQLRLQRAFGLRSTEALSLKPHEADQGETLHVYRGTKGGRGRVVPIRTDEQRRVLEKAKAMTNMHTGLVGRYGHNLKAAQSHYYYILEKHGISRRASGITAHGLRHAYANERFRELTGHKAPVHGGANPPRGTELLARGKITRELGHSRVNITTAYTGSALHMERTAFKRLKELLATAENSPLQKQVQEAREELAATGHGLNVFILGPEADGKSPVEGMPLLLGIEIEKVAPGEKAINVIEKAATLAYSLKSAASKTYGRICSISQMGCVSPEMPRLEIL